VNLNYELDRLYQLPLADFIGARNDLAKRLRADGDRDGAEQVKKLAKPSLTAWAVNQLHFQARPRLDALLATGERMRTAISEGAGAHQAAMKARREAIAELLAIAAEILDAGGQPLTRVHRQRLLRTLEALASGNAEAVPGRLSQDLEPPGFDALSGLAASLTQMPRRPILELVSDDPGPGELAEVFDFAAERQSRVDKAQEKKLAEAGRAVAAAEEKASEQKRRAGDARAALVEAERIEAEATAAVKEAERRVREAREKLEAAVASAAKARLESDAAVASAKRADDDLTAAKNQLQRLKAPPDG